MYQTSEYHCDNCIYEAGTLSDLEDHKQQNHNKSCFKCDECGIEVTSRENLEGHIQWYHESEATQTVFICEVCNKESESEDEHEEHIKKDHTNVSDFTCDKCEYETNSSEQLEKHRQEHHYYFMYHCDLCKVKTTNIATLKQHRETAHGGKNNKTKKQKVVPLPKCDPTNPRHSTDCCNRNPGQLKPQIYSKEERRVNGACLEWNKGFCDDGDLCKFMHIEIEECRYANFCTRSNCTFWHDVDGKFPFLDVSFNQKRGRGQ